MNNTMIYDTNNNKINYDNIIKKIKWATIAGTSIATGAFLASRFRVGSASEYIVKTGIFIKDIHITKKTVILPFQAYSVMSVEPVTFPIEVDAMSSQRIPFKMPSVWTIGPKNDIESLTKYARFLMDKGPSGVRETMSGVIQGETRVLTANLDLNLLFSERDNFKNKVVEKINSVVDPFGLTIYNANIAELKDLDDSNQFFSEQKRRALQRVNQEARVNVAEALKDGEIGERNFQSESRQGVALAEKNAKLIEYEREREIAESLKKLKIAQAAYNKDINFAEIHAIAETEERKWKLQMTVEEMRKKQEMERKRADQFTDATVKAEVAIKEAEGKAEVAIKEAEGEAEAIKIKSEANLFSKNQEALGIKALKMAEAEGLEYLIKSAGNADSLNKYLMIRDNMLPKLAEKQAMALRGLNPKISVWNTSGSSDKNTASVITDLFKTGMPLFDGIKEQTGYDFLKNIGVNNDKNNIKLIYPQ